MFIFSGKVHLSRDAHGPAITFTLKRPGSHDINVDMVPTIPSTIPVAVNGWPRPDTRRAYSGDQIQAVREAGLHLVPKNDTTWCTSFSKAERAMFAALDRGNGCRKDVLKYMKKIVQDETSKSPNGLPGVSSHLVKVILFSVLFCSMITPPPLLVHGNMIDYAPTQITNCHRTAGFFQILTQSSGDCTAVVRWKFYLKGGSSIHRRACDCLVTGRFWSHRRACTCLVTGRFL